MELSIALVLDDEHVLVAVVVEDFGEFLPEGGVRKLVGKHVGAQITFDVENAAVTTLVTTFEKPLVHAVERHLSLGVASSRPVILISNWDFQKKWERPSFYGGWIGDAIVVFKHAVVGGANVRVGLTELHAASERVHGFDAIRNKIARPP